MAQIGRIREHAALFIEQELKKEAIHGILPAHGIVLFFLFQQNHPVAMKEIVEKAGRVKSTVTGMVNTLEHHGYVEKFQSPEDGRVMLVQLTEKGRAIRPAFENISARMLEKLYGDMPQTDREKLIELLSQVLGNLKGA
ncbi:MarR family winged helix-turn-helix transcriptional regulator [Pontiella agarivorans]|uniref:MarR family transcriptional regulator n=1 Tax=Pontiella agarivorans TaxID=3038953 RepID=A0ABU5MV18_9BACT|nr:MarR family transcriptional regulator [Pontiella agarivorans]MDZ8117977.1 MarR family transcriptional regulator [Pontiella agarivorans]